MARRKFEDGFKERAVAYCHEHPEKTMKACAADLDGASRRSQSRSY